MAKNLKTNAISCRICGERAHLMDLHLRQQHADCSLEQYIERYPDAPLISKVLQNKWDAAYGRVAQRKRTPILASNRPTVTIGGLTCPINLNVPAEDCLPLPAHYQAPTHGKLGKDVEDAMESLYGGDSLFIHGPPGTGKDALIHAYAALCRIPSKVFQVQPRGDVQEWLYYMSFNAQTVIWEIGDLLAALKDGYTSPINGQKIPYLILISDFDRSQPEQAEIMRMITDSISGRVQGPKGQMYQVFPGTQIAFTGNSCGSGDERGLCISSNIMDSSLLDRIQAKYKFNNMDWADEAPILRSKFPDVVRRIGEKTFSKIGESIVNLRKEIDNEKIHAEFSHRTACGWFLKMRRKIEARYQTNNLPKTFLKDCARVFLDGMDKVNRENATAAINSFLDNGCIDEGDTSHITNKDLADMLR